MALPTSLPYHGPVWRVAFSIGHRTATGIPVAPAQIEQATTALKALLSDVCCGGQIFTHTGFYRMTSGAVVDEVTTTVYSYGQGDDIPVERFLAAAGDLARQLNQETVLLIIEQPPAFMGFVPPEPATATTLENGRPLLWRVPSNN